MKKGEFLHIWEAFGDWIWQNLEQKNGMETAFIFFYLFILWF